MSDLASATSVQVVDEHTFTAELSKDWEIWGPNGGYLAAIALRAAGIVTGRAVPVSINAHFVGASTSGPVTLRAEINRVTRVATSVTIRLEQNDRPVLVATIWGSDGLEGIEHQTDAPDVPDPESLRSIDDLMAEQGNVSTHTFWANFDSHPIDWIVDWDNREPSEPENSAWIRFVPTSTYEDRWLDACRPLILIDVDAWGAATRPHVGELEHFAPTIEVAVRFHGPTSEEEWLLSRARSPVATAGIVAATGEIWTRSGRLVATGGSTLLCRPAARQPG